MERKFETPNGNIVAESQLRRDYPSLFNKYVQEGYIQTGRWWS